MTDVFQFSQEEVLTFFCVLIRFSIITAVMPFFGDWAVPVPVKVLFGLAITIMVFPVLVSTGQVRPGDAVVWSSSVMGIVGTIAKEVLFGVVLAYVVKLIFDAVQVGAEIMGTFMGFAAASQFDPMQGSQTQTVTQIHMTIAMLTFLVFDGHHVMLKGALESYRAVGLGEAVFTGVLAERLLELSAGVLRAGLQIAAPMALTIFALNLVYGIMAKAIPQMNILILSFSISAIVGLIVMFISLPEFQATVTEWFSRIGEEMEFAMAAMAGR